MGDIREEAAPLLDTSTRNITIASDASTSAMTELDSDDDGGDEYREHRPDDDDEDTSYRKHLNRTRFDCFGTVIRISHAKLLCLVMVLDMMILTVQIPSMTAAFANHGMDLRWQGWVASIYGIISFFVGPMLGRVSDSAGRVAMLRISCIGNTIGALGSLYATGRWTFIASRTLPGLLKCSLPISQAYIVDVSESTERSKNLGMLGASFGLAFVLGPPLGGAAADYNVRLPFVISLVECVLLYVALEYLPEPAKTRASKKMGGDDGGDSGGIMKAEKALDLGNGIVGENGDKSDVVTATPPPTCSPRRTPTSTGPKSLTRVRPAESSSSSTGLKRTKSSLLIAALENGREKGAFAEDLQGGVGRTPPCSAVAPGSKNRWGSPGRARGNSRTAAMIAEGTTAAITAGLRGASAGGGGAAAAGGGEAGGRWGRLGIFRGPGGTQMAWGFHDRFFLVVAESMYHTSFVPFLTSVLAFPTGRVGVLLSFMGMVSALTNVFLVGMLTRRFGERQLMASSLVVLAVGWAMWSNVNGSLQSIVTALTLAGVGGNVFQTVNKAAVAQHAPSELVGTVMGMSAALETFGRSMAGPMSGYLYDAVGARGIPLTCSGAAAYVAMLLYVREFMGTVRIGEDAGGEVRDGPHKRDSRVSFKRK